MVEYNNNQALVEASSNEVPMGAIEGMRQFRLVVPVRDEWCVEQLNAWLAANRHLANSEIMLVHCIEPAWLTEIPYSGIEAIGMIREHREHLRDKRKTLRRFSQQLKDSFPELRVSWQVISASDAAQSVARLADDWDADCITLFARPKLRFVFWQRNDFVRQIMKRATKTVQLVQQTPHRDCPMTKPVNCHAV